MACIIKLPESDSKGVITFTDGERDNLIYKNNLLKDKISELKKEWLVGIHHNWHNLNFRYDPFFDFHMAGTEYLKTPDGTTFPQIPLAATNFAPNFFSPSTNEKFWDLICIGRAVKFKKIPELFATVRKLYDADKKYRFLFICSIPKYKWGNRRTALYNIREIYNEMFTEEEQDRFTLLTTTYRDPFPFDPPTIANFYKSSRVFAYFADNERQGRVVGNAFATGMRVVGMECIASPVPKHLQKPPYFYLVKNYDDFPKIIEEAVEESRKNNPADFTPIREYFSEDFTKEKLQTELKKLFDSKGIRYENKYIAFSNLALRLCRHNGLNKNTANGRSDLDMPLSQLIDILSSKRDELRNIVLTEEDPEIYLEKTIEIKKPDFFVKNNIGSILKTIASTAKRETNYIKSDLKGLARKILKN